MVSRHNEAQVIMSHHRENSVRGKLIGKKWIYLERNTLHRVGPYQERGWIISVANEWEDYSNYLGGGVEIFRNWMTTHILIFESWPWNCNDASECVISLRMCYTEPILRNKYSFKLTCLPSHWDGIRTH